MPAHLPRKVRSRFFTQVIAQVHSASLGAWRADYTSGSPTREGREMFLPVAAIARKAVEHYFQLPARKALFY
jgi:hypothetical protein